MKRTLQLRTRLAIACSLLIATTLVIGVWSSTAFRRVSHVVGETIADDEGATNATSQLAGQLEREDDAVLLTLTDEARGKADLLTKRTEVAAALEKVLAELDAPSERKISKEVVSDVAEYHAAVDELVAAPKRDDARTRYHEVVNPALRKAVGSINQVRDAHFRSSQAVAEWAADQATRSMQIVAAISAAALLLLVAIVLYLARVVMVPLGEMRRAVQAIRGGDFSLRVTVRRDDELGRLGDGLNRMADELEQFRRANVGEVIRAKETLEATLGALPDAVVVIDGERAIGSTNPQASALFGAALERERTLANLEVPDATRAAIETAIRSGAAPDGGVDLARAVEIGRRRMLPRVVPIEGADGVRGAVLVLSDVTELVRLDEMRLELVAVASHELRTPLTTLRMTLLMIQERAAHLDERDRELVATALGGIDQLATIVDEFLDLTHIEAGQLRLHWARLSLAELARHCQKAIAHACQDAQVVLSVRIDDDAPPTVTGDRDRLALVVSNLLSNAVKYTPTGGRIELAIERGAAPESVAIRVTDTGPGVPEELRARVFDKFFRVEHHNPGSEPGPRGSGIGLYIAREIALAHGGTIKCESARGGGARFSLELPIDSTRARAVA
ncbi:MAG TPA: ATP-binding protein [Kofleriaceae bacterium]|nr:ATP-binding protein [Kofleriaceae bacterium]